LYFKTPDRASIAKNSFLLFEKYIVSFAKIISEFSNVNASWKIKVLCVGVCQTKLPSLAFKAVTSPIVFIKNTTSPFVTRDNFF
jgi:hypothetical protein